MSEYTIVAALPCSAIFTRNIMLHTILYTQKRRNLDVKKGSNFGPLWDMTTPNFCQRKISPASTLLINKTVARRWMTFVCIMKCEKFIFVLKSL